VHQNCRPLDRDVLSMMIRFTIEQRHLTDASGKPVGPVPEAVSFHVRDAENAEDAVRVFARDEPAEIIGDILKFPGLQAVATIRKAGGVYTLQITPASHNVTL
jgi:hypothetical protein